MSDLQPLHDPSQQLVLTFVYAPDKNPALVYLAALSPVGRRGMAGRLRQVAQLLGYEDFVTVPWHFLRYAHLGAIRTKLSELGKAPATVNTTLYALRGVARAAFNLELMSAEDYQRLQGVKPLRGERLPAGRALAGGELTALMEACLCDDSPAGIRDCALIGLLYGAGLRRAEVVTLNLTDYDSANNGLRVQGKGNKERLVYLGGGADEALVDWLVLRGDEPGPLFLPINKGGALQWRAMSDQAIYNMLKKRAAEAVVKTLSPHDLRRSFISDLLDAGADISTASKLAGHASVQTTAKYDRRGEEAKKKAVKLLYVPYRKRS